MPHRLTRAWRRLEAFSERPAAVVVLVGIALAEYALVSLAFPLAPGRDLGTYLRASFGVRADEVVLPQALLSRAPVTGVVSEGLLAAGPVAAEVAMGLLYALSVLCWWRVARRFGAAPGLALAALLFAYPGYVLLFHRLASDALYAAAFALGALLTARLVESRTSGRAAAVGLALALLVLVRPVSQILIVLAPLLLLGRGAWRPRIGTLAALGVAAAAPLLLWAGHNAVRADDFTVVRGAGHGLPLYRAFVVDRIVSPENGEASRELARAVQQDLLPREPYRSYGIDLDTFFTAGSARMHEDLIGLSDRTWGWDDDYAHLSRVGREAVRAHPGSYARGVARDSWRLLWWPVFLPESDGDADASRELVGAAQLPEPSEGQPIPSASVSGFISTPAGRFREVWASPTEHEIYADDPSDGAHLDRMNRRVTELLGRFSDRSPSSELGSWLNRASRWFPRPVVWLVVALVAIAVRRPRGLALPLVLATAALLVVLGTSLAVPAAAEYSAPVAPAFMLLAVVGTARSTTATTARAARMKLVMTLLARNEADIVDAQIAFHLHAGVDFVIATDNGSDDGTLEILERYARSGRLQLLREAGEDMRQDEWVTRMARMAATEFGADWVINCDADEFWWPRGGTLKDVLGPVPGRYGVLRGCWRHFLPRPEVQADFAERMTVRLCTPAFPGDKSTIYHAHQKVAHRADPDVAIERGNHNAAGPALERPLRGWHPLEVLHFSLRSVEQLDRKARGGWLRVPVTEQTEHQLLLDQAYRKGTLDAFYGEHAISDAELERGLADGSLAVDTRLRDVLRTLREPDGRYRVAEAASSVTFEAPDYIADTAAYAAEASVLVEIDGIARAEQRVDALEARLARLRTLPRR